MKIKVKGKKYKIPSNSKALNDGAIKAADQAELNRWPDPNASVNSVNPLEGHIRKCLLNVAYGYAQDSNVSHQLKALRLLLEYLHLLN